MDVLFSVTSHYGQISWSSHVAYFVGYEIVVIAQEMSSGLSEDGDEVDVVRIPHYAPILFRYRSPCVAQSR